MAEQELAVGAVVEFIQKHPGQYEAVQKKLALGVPPSDVEGRRTISWGLGPIKVEGYVDLNTLEIGVNVSVVGINLGNIYGNLQDGVGVKIDIFVAKGEIKLYLKNGNEIWVHVDVQITFDGSYEGDYKILSI